MNKQKIPYKNTKRFNMAMYNRLLQIEKIISSITEGNVELYKLGFDENVAIKNVLTGKKNIGFSDSYIEYYWMEFKYNSNRYKISLFYKDFDTSSGNIHILPGAVQIWIEDDCICDKICHCTLNEIDNGIKPYKEYKWLPLCRKPIFIKDEKRISDIWNCIESQTYDTLMEKIINSNEFYKQYEVSVGEDFIKLKAGVRHGHYKKYSLLKWKESEKGGKKYINAPYTIYDCENQGYFTKYGESATYEMKTDKGHNEYVNGKWCLHYEQRKVEEM